MPRFRSEAYLDYVRGLPCCNCGSTSSVCAHHIKGVGNLSGAGLKAPDSWAMPLCSDCHISLHNWNNLVMLNEQFEWVARTLANYLELVGNHIEIAEFSELARLLGSEDGFTNDA